MVPPTERVPGQSVTWVGPPRPPPEQDLVRAEDTGEFVADEGDRDHCVVEFNGAVFCYRASDVRAEPRPPVPQHPRHHAA